jgi:hypothetical protein
VRSLIHFLVIGATLFALQRAWLRSDAAHEASRSTPARREPIVITLADIEELRADFTQRTGFAPTAADQAALVETAITDELLYREALARGLDRGDRSIRARLVEKMRFLSDAEHASPEALYEDALALGLDREDVVIRRLLIEKMRLVISVLDATPLTDADLEDHLARHRDRYLKPPRVTLWHVFLSADRHGDSLASAARALAAGLRADPGGPASAVERGDPFPLGQRFTRSSEHDLEKLFGSTFASAVMGLEPATWSQPIRSAYGLHLVWLEERTPPVAPPLDQVRRQVEQALRAERRQQRLDRELARLRREYGVRVIDAADPGGS